MNNDIIKVCRLCFKTNGYNDFDTIEVTKHMFGVLFLKLNLEISENPVMCNACMTNLQESFNFKSACVRTANSKLSCSELKETRLKEDERVELIDVFEDQKTCQFCRKLTEIGHLTNLQETKENVFIIDMLPTHFPELNLNTTEELLACEICLESLQRFFGFIMNCLHAEEKMENCVKLTKDKNDTGLKDVQEFEFKPILCDETESINEDIAVKVEITNEEYMAVDNSELDVKIEEVNIKMEPEEYESFQEDDTSRAASKNVHKCKLCGFQSKYKCNLTRHMLVHINPSDYNYLYNCAKCPFQTKYKFSLTQHMLIHKEPTEVTIHKCGLCTYRAIHKQYLIKHMLTHTKSSEIELHKCPLCSFATKRKQSLKSHLLTHENSLQGTKYKCEQCSYETKFLRNLRRHMKNHKEPVYPCETSEFETKHKSSLTNHILIHRHTEEMTMYKCGVCPFETKHKCEIDAHVHVKLRPTNHCEICRSENKHKSVSDLIRFKCNRCRFETEFKCHFDRHMRAFHMRSVDTTRVHQDDLSKLIKSRFLVQFKSNELKKQNGDFNEVTIKPKNLN